MLRPVMSSKYNSEATAFIADINVTRLHDAWYSKKYTRRKYWIEKSTKGMYRFCSQGFDSHRGKWVRASKEKYYEFVAMIFEYGSMKKIYVHENLHESYIREYLEKYKFDDKQISRLELLIEKRLTGVKHHGIKLKTIQEQQSIS